MVQFPEVVGLQRQRQQQQVFDEVVKRRDEGRQARRLAVSPLVVRVARKARAAQRVANVVELLVVRCTVALEADTYAPTHSSWLPQPTSQRVQQRKLTSFVAVVSYVAVHEQHDGPRKRPHGIH